MEKKEQLYEGKAKKLFATDDPTVLWVHYMNQATAGNGEKKALIEGKGRLNNLITSRIFELLASQGIHSHFIQQISQTDQLVQKMSMFPLEIIVRNIAAGSFARRYGIEEGALLKKPVLEFCLKSDDLADPFISQDAIVALDLASEEELKEICAQAYAINSALTQIFSAIDITLVDFKIEEGKNAQGEILLADEITPDTCRLWDRRNVPSENVENTESTEKTAIHHLDKDLFRRDLGDIIPAYEEIYTRLTDISLALPA